jgi:predicted secreted hydrolase
MSLLLALFLFQFARVTEPLPLAFPRDHGSHPAYQTEWWYFTGNLRDGEGARHGFQLTFFRSGITPSLAGRTSAFATRDLWLAHFALSDGKERRFFFDDRADRGSLGTAGAALDTLHVWLRDWRAQIDETGAIQLAAESQGHRLALTLRSRKGPVLHGDRGYSRKGSDPGNASMYVSLTDCAVTGELATPERGSFAVEGSAWMDHEFGSSVLSGEQVGWDWFSLQLGDGVELMLFQLRRKSGGADELSAGTLVRADGTTRALSRADFAIEVRSRWRSTHTGGEYPSAWTIAIPGEGFMLTLEPLLADQELRTTHSTGVTYWEGAVSARGTHGGKDVSGVGYVELVGYAGRVARF